ncbi:hypothetical protein MUK42_09981 [Musa troglodytarum]|uniref:Uncharacterized protein n=1 Tax=Musa troglodytarum TaxID=320322 RepID=A0A9E7EMP6_9LILI|nr:hypothetical protein MUK42_09981 [Musa troglodytarum]
MNGQNEGGSPAFARKSSVFGAFCRRESDCVSYTKQHKLKRNFTSTPSEALNPSLYKCLGTFMKPESHTILTTRSFRGTYM